MSAIFNSGNILILICIAFVCYTFWLPFTRGKKVEATVESYCHPKDGKNRQSVWIYCFKYRESKTEGYKFCYSRRDFKSKKDMDLYPKGSKVNIRCYDAAKSDPLAVIVDDKTDLHLTIRYTIFAIIGGIAIAIGYQMLNTNIANTRNS